ncbi:MAG: EamA family transporter [Alphaproteobacteria bacterium]|nr:EamA family transporter [Alphaproteobacteria bacterium]
MAEPTFSIPTRTITLTVIAMIAFAANSVLCRLALGFHTIDAASFATIRVVSGALTLSAIMLLRGNRNILAGANWRAALMLFAYVVFFTYAYISLSTGTGALILFGAVQLTMFTAALRSGESFSPLSWLGLGLAIAGLVYLVSPGVTAPDPAAALSMAIAGVSWGFYSLIGRGARDPLAATTGAFVLCVPAIVVVELLSMNIGLEATTRGLWLAVVSGAITSGLGYVIWYAALPGLGATSAATVQLSVPAIAALGGVLFLSEQLSVRLVVAAVATLGGVTVVLMQRAKRRA